jgi:hypothetical protein
VSTFVTVCPQEQVHRLGGTGFVDKDPLKAFYNMALNKNIFVCHGDYLFT